MHLMNNDNHRNLQRFYHRTTRKERSGVVASHTIILNTGVPKISDATVWKRKGGYYAKTMAVALASKVA